jgi:ribosomal protein L32
MMGLVHSNVCPFCGEYLQIKKLSLKEEKEYRMKHIINVEPTSGMYDLSKLLK